jgi:hypothetical protein
MFGIHKGMPSHPLSFSPSTLYKISTGSFFIESPKALSSGDNKVPVPFDMLRFLLTINIALFPALLAFKAFTQLINAMFDQSLFVLLSNFSSRFIRLIRVISCASVQYSEQRSSSCFTNFLLGNLGNSLPHRQLRQDIPVNNIKAATALCRADKAG